MNAGKVALAVGLAVVALFLWTRFRPGPPSEADRVRQAFRDACAAVERHSVRDVMGFVGDGYSDDQGNTRETLRSLAATYFLQMPRLSVTASVRQVNVTGDSATVSARVMVTNRDSGDRGDMNLDLRLEKEAGEWKVVHADGVKLSEP